MLFPIFLQNNYMLFPHFLLYLPVREHMEPLFHYTLSGCCHYKKVYGPKETKPFGNHASFTRKFRQILQLPDTLHTLWDGKKQLHRQKIHNFNAAFSI